MILQDGMPHLPGVVEDLPLDGLSWTLLLASCMLLVRGLAEAWLRRRSARPTHSPKEGDSSGTAGETAEELCRLLEQQIATLSVTQEKEARLLAQLVRGEVGSRCGQDLAAADESQLVAAAGKDETVPQLLSLSVQVLYAEQLGTAAQWQQALALTKTWLQRNGAET